MFPTITAATTVLAHVPGLVRYGSRPARDIARDPSVGDALSARLRTYDQAVAYPPNQVYVGNLEPEALRDVPRPWFGPARQPAPSGGAFGEILSEVELLGALKLVDHARLVQLDDERLAEAAEGLTRRRLATRAEFARLSPEPAAGRGRFAAGEALPLWLGGSQVGTVVRGHDEDEALRADVLLENLASKATAALALRRLLADVGDRLDADAVDFVIAGSEEAVGDRYQRGGGNMGKAIAEDAGLKRASGLDVKAFCASTLYAVISAAALIQAGLFSRVAVVAGGSLAKLGMKYRAHLAKDMPVLEDVLAGVAILVEQSSGQGPAVRLDTVGLHSIGSGASQRAIVEALVMSPLGKAGYRMTDIDRYATEMHNPEITEPAGAGDVPATNYRLIAALGAMQGQIPRDGVEQFVAGHGLPGFAPTQGHIASAVCYVPHAIRALRAGRMSRVLLMAKGSLFLGRMTEMSDGVSVIAEA